MKINDNPILTLNKSGGCFFGKNVGPIVTKIINSLCLLKTN